MRNVAFIVVFALQVACVSNASAGQYKEYGYVTELEANMEGGECTLMIGDKDGINRQGGSWSCNNIMGQSMLSLAQMAKQHNLKVRVILECNGQKYKPLWSINVYYN